MEHSHRLQLEKDTVQLDNHKSGHRKRNNIDGDRLGIHTDR